MPFLRHIINENIPGGLRLDRYIAEHLRLLSRSQIKARSLTGSVNGKKARLSRAVKQGDTVELAWNDAEPYLLESEDIPLDIIYEDERVVVIDKPQGMVVHPGAGRRSGTLANALHFRRRARGVAGESLRPGIVHRLDKDTSGVIIASYDDAAHAFLAEQFKNRTVKKTYIAIVNGKPHSGAGRIETMIARSPKDRKKFAVTERGKPSVTLYKVVKAWRAHSLVLLRPKTGRTHQLRVHLRHIGCPIAGDPIYGTRDPFFRETTLMLHAKTLEITLPGEGGARVFKSPVPERFKKMIRRLNRQ